MPSSPLLNMLNVNLSHSLVMQHAILLILRGDRRFCKFPLLLIPLVQILPNHKEKPREAYERDIDRIPLLPPRCLQHRKHHDWIKRKHGPTSRQHGAHRHGSCLCIVSQSHIDKWHQYWRHSRRNSKQIITRKFQTLGDEPGQHAGVGEQKDALDDGEDDPERVDDTERSREDGGDDGDALGAGGNGVYLRDRVGAVFGGKIFEPQGHLTVRVGGG